MVRASPRRLIVRRPPDDRQEIAMRPLTAVVALSLAVLAAAPVRAQDKVGIAICDDFLAKYETCAKEKMPADQRSPILDSITQMRSVWKQTMTSSPQSKDSLEATCRQSMDAMKASLGAAYGCAF
jgi:hypothetical protein